ncbi:hypothetical protein H6P81_015775 [Aristolochia fimbriata]|uniref:Enhancer of polycomb-like protein n=1 Tax=Aristolochia fimbriata TaxID=158543 RepID=A0AAV7E6H2_ARIFI|nr:hypothetical protein H6P81_015775 [Aristolochia fimbriata]
MRRCVGTEAVAIRVSKLYDIDVDGGEGELAKIAASRVRIFPFGDVPSSMPSVGTRRSTRVFVPKSVKTSPDVDTVRVLRSGKRLSSDTTKTHGEDDDWLKLLGSPRVDAADFRRWKRENRWHANEMVEAECYRTGLDNSGDSGDVRVERSGNDVHGVLPAKVDQERRFGIVYSRKRRRAKDRMYGIQFVRKQRRKKGLVGHTTETGKLENCMRGFVCSWASLVIFVRFSRSSLVRFERLFITVLRWMKKSHIRLAEFAAFLLSESMSVVLSQHGIHFSVQCNLRDRIRCSSSGEDAISTDGICTVYGACNSVPSVSVNFSALPCYFMNLHVKILMRSFYLPPLLAQYLQTLLKASRGDIIVYTDWISCYLKNIHQWLPASSTNSSLRNAIQYANKTINVTSENITNRKRGKFRRNKKRNSSRFGRGARHSLANSGLNGLIKLPSVADSMMGSVVVRPIAAYDNDLSDGKDRYSIFSSSRPNGRQRKSVRYSSSEKLKELKSTLVDIKQNLDTIRCAANVLVMQSDMCWRECGAEVMLESSNSKEWRLAVKTRGTTRYLHKAQEMRPSTSNRFTHAMMWAAEDGWKLEFCDRKDWMMFKELHRECCERNLQAATAVRTIPVPGVREVVGYEDGDNFQFVRPDVYISVEDDEIQRALMADSLYYDMDSEDEDWLEQLNCDVCESGNSEDGHNSHISKDNFEKIMYAFEKTAYSHPDDFSEESKALSLCPDLGRREILTVIFDYWLKKRKQKKVPLVRVFQAPPLKRAQLVQKPIFRKKRSFKRQASQVGRNRTESSVDVGAKEDVLRRVQEAEQAAKKAMDLATAKRSRAQMLMHNADLLTYKSVMAARIAEAAQLGDSCNAATSSIFV